MTTIEQVQRKSGRRRSRRDWDQLRRGLAIGAVIATVPYSALKVAWLSGSRIGLSDPDFGTSITMHVANGLTLGLDLVAMALAVVFFRGVRAPGWFVLSTMWIGFGLLGQIVMVIGPTVVVQLSWGSPARSDATSPIAGWVYGAVYTGFIGLGLCLLPAFTIYAWQRWADTRGWRHPLGGIRRDLPVTPTLLASVLTLALLLRAALSDSALDAMAWAVDGLIGLIVVITVLAAGGGRPVRVPRAAPLLLVWTASGAWTAWGCFSLVLATVPNDLVDTTTPMLDVALYTGKVVAGAALLPTVRRLATTGS